MAKHYDCDSCEWAGSKSETKCRVPGVAGTGRKCPDCGSSVTMGEA